MGCRISIGTDAASGCGTGQLVDSYLEVYRADCPGVRLASDDDSGPGWYSLIADFLLEADTYYIKVRGFSSLHSGCYKLVIKCEGTGPSPVNDNWWGAVSLSGDHGAVLDSLDFAYNDYDPEGSGPSCTGHQASGRDVVYAMDLFAGCQVHLEYGGGFDSSFYIVTDCDHAGSTCVAGADAHADTLAETIDWTCTEPGLYYVICDAYHGAAGGLFRLEYWINCPPVGACCSPEGACSITAEAGCPPGYPWYSGFDSCLPNPCMPQAFGACCLPDGQCIVATEAECQYLGSYQGDYTYCDPNPCLPSTVVSGPVNGMGEGILTAAPNPFRGTTALSYRLARAERLRLEVFDVVGQSVRSVDLGRMGAGVHSVEWDGRGPGGGAVAPGVYFARLSTGGQSWTRALIRIE